LLVCNDQLRFNKISNIWIIIYSSWYEPCSRHCMSSSWYYHYFNFISIKYLSLLFNVALYYRNGPKWVNILKFEILSDFVVPQISIIEKLFSKLVWIIFTRRELKLYCSLSLLATRYVCMITIIKALSLK